VRESGLVTAGGGTNTYEPVSNLSRFVSALPRRHEVLLGAEQITRCCMPKTQAEELFTADLRELGSETRPFGRRSVVTADEKN